MIYPSTGISFTNHPFHLISPSLVLFTTFVIFPSFTTASDFTSFVYKGCAKETFLDSSGVHSQTLSTLFDSLVSQSSKTMFFKTSSSGDQLSTSALFQCKGDLSNGDCYNCVGKLPQLLNTLCGKTTAGRVQLLGCYIYYEPSGFPQISGFEMLYKTCSVSQVVGSGFEERRDTAFAALERGIVSGYGFYTASYESVYVWSQCEGDLGIGDCGECVKSAIQKAQVECGSSISGQIYLHKCFMSYAYYPSGISRKSSSGGRQTSGKTAAIVVGGAAIVVFAVMFLMFIKSLRKKHDEY